MMTSPILNSLTALSTVEETAEQVSVSTLSQAEVGLEYTIQGVDSCDTDIVNFLFTLGCFQGEVITLISILSDSYIVSIKDARYSFDSELAEAIRI